MNWIMRMDAIDKACKEGTITEEAIKERLDIAVKLRNKEKKDNEDNIQRNKNKWCL